MKYDILTNLALIGLRCDDHMRLLALRLNVMITARYDWVKDLVSIGHSQLALLWNVSTRTVKRDMAALVEAGLLAVVRRGRRGQVGAYRLNRARVMELAREDWHRVGPDFLDRMATQMSPVRQAPMVDPAAQEAPPTPPSNGFDQAVKDVLRAREPQSYEAWFARLRFGEPQGGQVSVTAPSAFQARYLAEKFDLVLRQAVVSVAQAPLRLEISGASGEIPKT
ncbi:MAG: hypothetical protein ACPGNV_14560 [Mangrovicoccus sp.]